MKKSFIIGKSEKGDAFVCIDWLNNIFLMCPFREKVKQMFYHAYDSYVANAFAFDELKPITCEGMNTWGSFQLTTIDALDTLLVLGNYTEFERISNYVIQHLNFDQDINVSVFETNIRGKQN